MNSCTRLPFRFRAAETKEIYHAMIITGLVVFLTSNIGCVARHQTTENDKEKKIMNEVSGSLEVRITPEDTGDDQMGMMLLDKTYHGDLQATGTGRMLTGMTAVKGSAGYVAIERLDGTLEGAKGTFLVQHSGISKGDEKTLLIQVIPDSGTDALLGIDGTMEINIDDGKHSYCFKYSLPTRPNED